MALCHLPNTIACTSPLFFLSSTPKHRQQLECQANDDRFRIGLICFSSAKKPRMSKKIKPPRLSMSDADLCNEIRDFASAEGLPKNYIPSMAQLSRRGRNDLTDFVRRRGFRVVAHLLRTQTNGDVFKPETNLSMNQDSTNSNLQTSVKSLTPCSIMLAEDDDDSGGFHHHWRIILILYMHDSAAVNNTHSQSPVMLMQNEGSVISQETADLFPSEPLRDADLNKESEIDHLKTMLNKKEVELLILKKEIEKEQLALSAIQNKANVELSNIQSLLLAKDAELRAAEEGVLGLKEVQIEYHVNGEIVEVTGSFNGWHHPIQMEPHYSSATNQGESKSWMVTLWLYPGVYEIKFVVDGDWKIDCEREIITRDDDVCNNLLMVEI